MSQNKLKNTNLSLVEPDSIELPKYLRILDNFMLVGFLIPTCCWLFFIFYFKQLPPAEYKYTLRYIWFAVSLFPIPSIILTQLLLALTLSIFGTKVYGQDYAEKGSILPAVNLYTILDNTTGVKKLLIWLVLIIKLLIPFFFGWVIFGGSILFFTTASHV